MSKRENDYTLFFMIREMMLAGVVSSKEIAERMGISESKVEAMQRILADTGFDPKNGRQHINPPEQIVKGYTTLVRLKDAGDGSAGNVLEWVKTNVKLKDQLATAKLLMQALVSEIEPIPEIRGPVRKSDQKNLFTVIPLGDPHIGLKVWERQTGNTWDIEIAKRVFRKVIARLLKASPDTDEVILVNTGDFFHADNMAGVTSRSGHKLDMDGTPGMWTDAGMVIMRMIIDACLAKYKKVHFVNIPGNHDDFVGRMLGGFVEQLYLKNKRVTVSKGDNPFQYVHRGNVLLGFAHGHTCRLSSLPGKMADDQARLWGITTCRHWFTGHVHHNQWLQFKEHPGCKVETVGIIPPKDAYAHGGAYGADRSVQAIVFDSKNGYQPCRYMETVRQDD